MKFSESWLREWVNPDIDTKALVEQLTMAGLEVDAVSPVSLAFSGVIVGEVLSAEKHPDADKLNLCQVSNGVDTVQVVCGAPNARAGLKVAFAEVGAVLGDDFKIKKAKLRGVESFGMLCSEDELGLSESAEGIMELPAGAPVGENLRQYLNLDDICIEVDLTPNRGDCLGIKGLAREVGVLNKHAVNVPPIDTVSAQTEATFPVVLSSPEDCPRYVGRVIQGIDIAAKTPLWMVEKLRRSGIRSIDPVVDVTNYVLLELGQPMHAFDLDKLEGNINVRRAEPQEKLTLLDGKEVIMDAETLVIADDSGPLAMAGIMGGENSGVSVTTTNIFLESAFFNPLVIAGKARSYGLHTDSSHRFERGVDFKLQEQAIERATSLLLEIVGGQPGPLLHEKSAEHLPSRKPVYLRAQKVAQLLDLQLEAEEIEGICTRLGLVVSETDELGWTFDIPSYRFDIEIEADLLEEIARVYGYNRLPTALPSASLALKPAAEETLPLMQFKRQLQAKGYCEAVTYSFVDPELQQQIETGISGIRLANPISADMAEMRTSLWTGLLKALIYNANRQQNRVRLFESGLVFNKKDGAIIQVPRLAGVVSGNRSPEIWAHEPSTVDFFDVKADVESLLALSGDEPVVFRAAEHSALHPGQSAAIDKDGRQIGWLGALHPSLEKSLGINGPVYLFDLEVESLCKGTLPQFAELSKFPEVRRDLAIIVDDSVAYVDIESSVRDNAGEDLVAFTLFDLYSGKGVTPGRKSLAMGLTWQNRSRTLNDGEIARLVDNIINNLEKEFHAELRG